MCNPRVYVGTYGKYNRGSIAGGWVSLRDCKDYRQFLSKCRALHRGERDPEYMIQDTEDFPDGLSCMEWLSEQDFNDVIAACKEEDEREPALSIADQLRAALRRSLSPDPIPKCEGSRKPESNYKAWLEEFISTDVDDADYYRKYFVGAVKMGDHYYLIEKPSIDNRFCFHDEGPQYDFYCELMADKEKRLAEYFKSKNLSKFDRLIDHIENGNYGDNRIWWSRGECHTHRTYIYTSNQFHCDNDKYKLCTDEERAQILAGLKFGRAAMEKRLDAYLKRYGVSKIHTWTYWADA